MGSDGAREKNDYAGEDQQKFTELDWVKASKCGRFVISQCYVFISSIFKYFDRFSRSLEWTVLTWKHGGRAKITTQNLGSLNNSWQYISEKSFLKEILL
jgi:hypothetical protein